MYEGDCFRYFYEGFDPIHHPNRPYCLHRNLHLFLGIR
uniref:Uncharacterized protein n=1 Tax=Arundo donax TaxID=35708 RepID=A0A0A9AUP9_ARUDO